MGSLIGSCIGGCCASLTCGACKECSGHKYGPISRLPYIFLFFIAGVFSIIMSLYGEEKIDAKITSFQLCNNSACQGNGSVFRTSFILFAFELVHVLFIGCGLIQFHYLFFGIKFMVFVAALTCSLVFVSDGNNNFFDGWSDAARYFSGLYLLLQLLILITLGYDMNDYLQRKSAEIDDENEDIDPEEQKKSCNCWLVLMAVTSFGLYIFTFTFLGLFYRWYTTENDCNIHRSFITTTIILVIITMIMSIVIGSGNFFVSSIINTYAVFLLWSGIQADPNEACNTFATKRSTLSLWLGFIITFLALFYAALRANLLGILAFRDEEPSQSKGESIKSPLLNNSDAENVNDNTNKNQDRNEGEKYGSSNYDDVDDNRVRVPSNVNDNNNDNNSEKDEFNNKNIYRKQNTYFHIIMTLAAAYFAMLFTNWGTNDNDVTTQGTNSMWVTVITQWVCFVLFWWTMIAPKVCPSRFGISDEQE